MSSLDIREVVRWRGEVTMAPSRCPGKQYYLENETRWMKVERQGVDLKR
jgi:hypothetical protein